MYFPIYQIVMFVLTLITILFGYLGVVKMRDGIWLPTAVSTSAAVTNLVLFVLVITNTTASAADMTVALINTLALIVLCSAAAYADGYEYAKKLYQTEKLKNEALIGEDGELNNEITDAAYIPKTTLEELN